MTLKKYYLQNRFGRVEEVWLVNDYDAIAYAQNRNRKQPNANWKTYDERGNLVYAVVSYQ